MEDDIDRLVPLGVLAIVAFLFIVVGVCSHNIQKQTIVSATNSIATNKQVPDPIPVVIVTQYMVVPDLEGITPPMAELPPGYKLTFNGEWYGYIDGNNNPHPYFTCDDGYKTRQEAISSAWKSHIKRTRYGAGETNICPNWPVVQ